MSYMNSLQNTVQPSYDEETAGNPVFAVEPYDPDNPYITHKCSNQQSYEEEVEGNNPDNPIIIVDDRDHSKKYNELEYVLSVDGRKFFNTVKNSLGEFSIDFKHFKHLLTDYITSKPKRVGPLMFRRWARLILRNHTEQINGLNTFLPSECHISNSSAIEHPEDLFIDFIKIVTKKYPVDYVHKTLNFLIIKENYATGIADKKESLEKLAALFLQHEELLLEFLDYEISTDGLKLGRMISLLD